MSEAFIAPERLLLGPGPTNTDPRVLQASAQPTIGHLDPEFQRLMEEIKVQLRELFGTQNKMTFPISAPASLAMEAAIVNVLERGEKAIIAQNGVFGGRMADIVKRCGGELVHLEFEWGKPVDVERVKAAISEHPDAKMLGFVHAETSTGVRSDARALCALAEDAGMLSVIDTVTGLGGIEVAVDEWGADVVYSGSQKCLAVPPGLAPITFSPRAIAKIESRKTPVQSWFSDLNLVLGYWSGANGGAARSYHHTAPVNALYGLHEGLRLALEEGIAARIERHRDAHNRLAQGLAELGLEFLVEAGDRLPQLNTISVPEGVDEAAVRKRLLDEYNIEIGAGLGPMAGKIWRIGLMGQNASAQSVEKILNALRDVL